jgi:hypothetical protein
MVALINLYKKPLDKQIVNFYRMMKNKYKGKNVLQIIYRKMEDEDKVYKKSWNIQIHRNMKSLNIILICYYWLEYYAWLRELRAQNTYIDVTTTAALKLYSDNLKSQQNKTVEEQTKLQQAQAWVASQMVLANNIQNKVLKGLQETSERYKTEYKSK